MVVDTANITKQDLTDNTRFLNLYGAFVHQGWWGCSYPRFLEFASYGQKALDEDSMGSPGRLFASLIKANDGRITQDQEDRAHQRFKKMGSELHEYILQLKQELSQKQLQESELVNPLANRNIGFTPVITAQCFFPQRKISDRRWKVTHGKASLLIEAGSISDREQPGEFREAQVPFGRLARLIFIYIVGESVRTKSPRVDMGRSMRSFMRRLGIPLNGRIGREVTRAVEDISAASLVLGFWGDAAVRTSYARVVDEISFWIEPDENQLTFWTPEIVLSDKFHDQIQAHRVPIDIDQLNQLSHSPRRMDLYTWLTYRTANIPARKSVMIHLTDIKPLFGPDIQHMRNFKSKLKEDLLAIRRVWQVNAEVQDDYLVLRRTTPPVPPRALIQTPK